MVDILHFLFWRTVHCFLNIYCMEFCTLRACLYGGELLGKASYSPKQDKQVLCLYGMKLLYICCIIATWRWNGANTQKGFKSFDTLNYITKCHQNTRISTGKFRKTYSYVFLSYYISIAKHIYLGLPVTQAKCLHGKIFISPRRYPTSFCRELAKLPRWVTNFIKSFWSYRVNYDSRKLCSET
jgi:hypothetical protein